ncbi:hypothetical protein JCM6882_004166 [Rhodosporidiobolus microsporus]
MSNVVPMDVDNLNAHPPHANDNRKNSTPSSPLPTSDSPSPLPACISSADGKLAGLLSTLELLPAKKREGVRELVLSVDEDETQKKDKVLPRELVQPILDVLPSLTSVTLSDVGWPRGCFDLMRLVPFPHLKAITLIRCRLTVSWPQPLLTLTHFTLAACHLDHSSVASLFDVEHFPALNHLSVVGNNSTPFGSELSEFEQKRFRFLVYRLQSFTVDFRNLGPASGNSITLPFTSSFPRLLVDGQFKHLETAELSRCVGFLHHLRLYHAVFRTTAQLEAASTSMDVASVAAKQVQALVQQVDQLRRLLETKHPLLNQLQALILPTSFSSLPSSLSSTVCETFAALLGTCESRRLTLLFEDRDKSVHSPAFIALRKGVGKPLTKKQKAGLEERWEEAMWAWEKPNGKGEGENNGMSGSGGSSGRGSSANSARA